MSREFLLLIIESSGKSKKEFALEVGVIPGTVQKWLTGISKPAPEYQARIRDKFKREIAKLYK
ncbi:hypothetical protein ACFQO9_04630 [Chryseobacterium zhengzhouense]|uniref:HTH cro/C1-type domain-containing protein n=1 Tax=Chryseobacterium zhengzhouense TaxID=1636086 RepID=A0ABW2LXK4_9FLAO